jgi:hypothetical protein
MPLKVSLRQVCQIFLDTTTYQNGKNIPDDHRLNHRAMKYIKGL